MIGAVVGMYFRPQHRNEPFGPMMVLADGSRSAAYFNHQNHDHASTRSWDDAALGARKDRAQSWAVIP
jgi:hypothetical protein